MASNCAWARAGMNQRWQAVVVKESFQRVEASHQLIGGRRNIARVIQRAARAVQSSSGCAGTLRVLPYRRARPA